MNNDFGNGLNTERRPGMRNSDSTSFHYHQLISSDSPQSHHEDKVLSSSSW